MKDFERTVEALNVLKKKFLENPADKELSKTASEWLPFLHVLELLEYKKGRIIPRARASKFLKLPFVYYLYVLHLRGYTVREIEDMIQVLKKSQIHSLLTIGEAMSDGNVDKVKRWLGVSSGSS